MELSQAGGPFLRWSDVQEITRYPAEYDCKLKKIVPRDLYMDTKYFDEKINLLKIPLSEKVSPQIFPAR